MGKGSQRRPCLVPRATYEQNWARTFGYKLSDVVGNEELMTEIVRLAKLPGPPKGYATITGLTDGE